MWYDPEPRVCPSFSCHGDAQGHQDAGRTSVAFSCLTPIQAQAVARFVSRPTRILKTPKLDLLPLSSLSPFFPPTSANMKTSVLAVAFLCLFAPTLGRPVGYDPDRRSVRVLLAVISTATGSDDVSVGSEKRQALRKAYTEKGTDVKFIVSKHAATDAGWIEWESRVTNDIIALDAHDAASDGPS